MLLLFRFALIVLSVMTLEGCVRADYYDYPRSKTYYIQPSYDKGYHSETTHYNAYGSE